MTVLRSTGLTDLVTDVLRQAPKWARRDLAAREQATRVRAEDTLAAMIAAAIRADQPS